MVIELSKYMLIRSNIAELVTYLLPGLVCNDVSKSGVTDLGIAVRGLGTQSVGRVRGPTEPLPHPSPQRLGQTPLVHS